MANQSFYTEKKSSNGLINPLVPCRSDICPFCNVQAVELYSFNNIPQGYRDAVEARLRGYNVNFNRYDVRYMRCKSCKKEFTIDWTDGFPVPLKDTLKTTLFFSEFMSGY